MGDITLKAMPFDSNEILNPATGEMTFDRVAYSRDLADWLRTYISNGVLVQGGNVLGSQLQVLHKEALTCTVKAGAVCINGRTGWLEADTEVTVEMGGAQPRVDRLVVELNIPNDRGIYIKVLKGTPAVVPTPPSLTQTEDVYQIPLAKIKVAAASATISEIVDDRPDYISNVTIGIKPPTGMDAKTVTLSTDTANLYGTTNVDDALLKSGISLYSYLAFCGNVNPDMLNAAFGKGNEEIVRGIGKQLAMYAWFKGDNVATYPFNILKYQSTFLDCVQNAFREMRNNANIINTIKASPYANNLAINYVPISGDIPTAITPANFIYRNGAVVTDYEIHSISIPISGEYKVEFSEASQYGSSDIKLKKNGITIATGTRNGKFSQTFFLISGDVLSLTISQTITSYRNKFSPLVIYSQRPIVYPTTVTAGDRIVQAELNPAIFDTGTGAKIITFKPVNKAGTYRLKFMYEVAPPETVPLTITTKVNGTSVDVITYAKATLHVDNQLKVLDISIPANGIATIEIAKSSSSGYFYCPGATLSINASDNFPI